ncbi:hypothetical protein HK102_004200 [Quaeritorhiza haematococci]|nr:hypothetical protein HK102_004200 [Quaeritorhiza haematococci]
MGTDNPRIRRRTSQPNIQSQAAPAAERQSHKNLSAKGGNGGTGLPKSSSQPDLRKPNNQHYGPKQKQQSTRQNQEYGQKQPQPKQPRRDDPSHGPLTKKQTPEKKESSSSSDMKVQDDAPNTVDPVREPTMEERLAELTGLQIGDDNEVDVDSEEGDDLKPINAAGKLRRSLPHTTSQKAPQAPSSSKSTARNPTAVAVDKKKQAVKTTKAIKKQSGVKRLPAEVWERILEFVPESDLGTLCDVCHLWRRKVVSMILKTVINRSQNKSSESTDGPQRHHTCIWAEYDGHIIDSYFTDSNLEEVMPTDDGGEGFPTAQYAPSGADLVKKPHTTRVPLYKDYGEEVELKGSQRRITDAAKSLYAYGAHTPVAGNQQSYVKFSSAVVCARDPSTKTDKKKKSKGKKSKNGDEDSIERYLMAVEYSYALDVNLKLCFGAEAIELGWIYFPDFEEMPYLPTRINPVTDMPQTNVWIPFKPNALDFEPSVKNRGGKKPLLKIDNGVYENDLGYVNVTFTRTDDDVPPILRALPPELVHLARMGALPPDLMEELMMAQVMSMMGHGTCDCPNCQFDRWVDEYAGSDDDDDDDDDHGDYDGPKHTHKVEPAKKSTQTTPATSAQSSASKDKTQTTTTNKAGANKKTASTATANSSTKGQGSSGHATTASNTQKTASPATAASSTKGQSSSATVTTQSSKSKTPASSTVTSNTSVPASTSAAPKPSHGSSGSAPSKVQSQVETQSGGPVAASSRNVPATAASAGAKQKSKIVKPVERELEVEPIDDDDSDLEVSDTIETAQPKVASDDEDEDDDGAWVTEDEDVDDDEEEETDDSHHTDTDSEEEEELSDGYCDDSPSHRPRANYSPAYHTDSDEVDSFNDDSEDDFYDDDDDYYDSEDHFDDEDVTTLAIREIVVPTRLLIEMIIRGLKKGSGVVESVKGSGKLASRDIAEEEESDDEDGAGEAGPSEEAKKKGKKKKNKKKKKN